MKFLEQLNDRNAPLYWLGLCHAIGAIVFLIWSQINPFEYGGVNAWYKPVKFMLSIAIYSWAMGWYTSYLNAPKSVRVFNWIAIGVFALEIVYITIQASRGLDSHYNVSTPTYVLLFNIMGVAATLIALATAYIGILFCTQKFPELPKYYVWAIRFGIFIFVLFALEGHVLGGNMSHSVGISDGKDGLPFLNWSKKVGDLRVAHFIGMHALQLLPLLAFYVLKKTWLVFLAAFLYGSLCVYVLVEALQGNPFLAL